MRRLFLFLFTFIFFQFLAYQAFAVENQLEQDLIQDNIIISNWFNGVAEGLDLFLAGKKITDKKNDSHFFIENSTYIKEGEGVKNVSNLGVNLRLPNVEEYWQLKFTSYDEEEESHSVQTKYLRQNPREQNYGATIGVFKKLGDIRTSFQPRIDLQDPLKISHSLKFESVADLKKYKINPKLEFYANPDSGTGIFGAINFNFALNKVFSLTLINDFNYVEKKHLNSVENGFSIGQVVSDKTAFSYTLIFGSNNRPSYHLDSYSPSFSWNQLIYKNILSLQLTPYMFFAKEQQFRGRFGLTFNLNLNF